MKFKQQEEEQKSNTFLDSVIDLISMNQAFIYGLDCYRNMSDENRMGTNDVRVKLSSNLRNLIKLSISLNPEHVEPTFTVECKPLRTIRELKTIEEKYYNMLKEIGNNALEQNNAEVFSYLSPIISDFKHYFCTLDEDNDSGETSS